MQKNSKELTEKKIFIGDGRKKEDKWKKKIILIIGVKLKTLK